MIPNGKAEVSEGMKRKSDYMATEYIKHNNRRWMQINDRRHVQHAQDPGFGAVRWLNS